MEEKSRVYISEEFKKLLNDRAIGIDRIVSEMAYNYQMAETTKAMYSKLNKMVYEMAEKNGCSIWDVCFNYVPKIDYEHVRHDGEKWSLEMRARLARLAIQQEMPKEQYTYDYPMPAITADIVVLRRNSLKKGNPIELLLVKRRNEPYKDCWALPGGFMEIGERLYACAKRELKEETGIDAPWLSFCHIRDAVGRDPRGRVLSAVYLVNLGDKSPEIKAADDAAEVRWFTKDELKKVRLAFDHASTIQELRVFTKM